MSRLFGVFSHAAGPVAPLLRLVDDRCRVPAETNRHGYGMGYAHGGDVLLQRRPQVRDLAVDLAQAANDIRTNAFLAHVRRAEVGGLKFENTQPFRFGPWLFAQVGTLPGGPEVYESVRSQLPDSLVRNVSGETDAEHFFHLFLSRLNDEGISPRLWSADPARVARTLGATLTAWQLAGAGSQRDRPLEMSALLTNGQSFFALTTGLPLWVLPVRPTPREFAPLPLNLAASHGEVSLGLPAAVVFVDGPDAPSGATAIPSGTVVTLDRSFRLAWHPAQL
jgi:predicted glutamine amidotransferase